MADQHRTGAQPGQLHLGAPADALMEAIWDMMIAVMGMVMMTVM